MTREQAVRLQREALDLADRLGREVDEARRLGCPPRGRLWRAYDRAMNRAGRRYMLLVPFLPAGSRLRGVA